eukprot:RCo008122
MDLLAKCPWGLCRKPLAGVDSSAAEATDAEKTGVRSCVQVPFWLLVGLLSVVSLVIVGVLTYFLVYNRTSQAMDSVAVSYRGLGFEAVENKVTSMLGQVATMTKLLGVQAPTPGDVLSVELRKQELLGIPMMPIANDYFVGFSTGEVLGIHRNAANNALNWQISNNLTGYRIGGLPAVSWGEDWLSHAN